MAEKILNTRVQLRYDSLTNWETQNPVLKKGEIALATVETATGGNYNVPTVLMKVGDGTSNFNTLKWVAAQASDVYTWAKQANLPVVRTDEEGKAAGNVISSVAWDAANGRITYTTASVATSEGMEELTERVAAIEDAPYATEGHVSEKIGKAVETINAAIALKLDKSEFETFKTTNTQAIADAKTGAEATAQGALDAYAASNAVELGKKLDKTTFEGFQTTNTQAIADALQAAKDYADANDANDNTEYHIEYDKDNKKIILVAGADAGKMEIPTDDFIKDGMIDTVALSEDGKNLVITWNTDAGKDVTTIPLSGLVDVYTGSTDADKIKEIKVEVSNDNKISASLVDGGITKAKLEQSIQDSLALADSAIQEADLAPYAKTEDVTSDIATAKGEAIADAEGKIATAKGEAIADAEGKIATAKGEAIADAEGKVNALANGAVKTNTEAIEAINDEEDGILAQAKAYADSLEHENTTYTVAANGGLKLEGTEFSIDNSLTFVFNCGDASGNPIQ